MHQLKAQDELFVETSVEYEDYLKGLMEMKLEGTPEFQAIINDNKDAMRKMI